MVFNAQTCCLKIKQWHEIYWAVKQPPLPACRRRLTLAAFDLLQMAEKVRTKRQTPFSHPPVPLRAHADMPGDSDLHGHRRCDKIYDIYNILDPLASIMK